MTVTPFVRLPVVAADGSVFAYVFDAQGIDVADASGMLGEVLTEFRLDDLALDRTLVLPGTDALLQSLETDRPAGVDLAVSLHWRRLTDPALDERVQRLRGHGVAVLVTDVDDAQRLTACVGHCDGALVDARGLNAATARSLCEAGADADLAVLVTGVATPAQHQELLAAGAIGTGGPHTLTREQGATASVASQQLVALRLAGVLSDPDYDVRVLADLVRSDAGLSLRLLRMVNSAASSQRREVTSIQSAIVSVGPRVLRDWAYLASGGQQSGADLERALMVLVRARFCEELAALTGGVDRAAAFVCGLLSGVVDVYGADPATVLGEVSVPAEVREAISSGAGPLGQVLVVAGSHGSASGTATMPGLTQTDVMRAYLHAVSATGRAARATDHVAREARQGLPGRRSELGRRLDVARFSQPAVSGAAQ